MTEATKKLREPAAWALLAYVAISLLITIIDLLVGVSQPGYGNPTFSDRAANYAPDFVSFKFDVALLFAVVVVHVFGEVSKYAKTVTLIALVEYGVAILFGLISIFSAFGSNAGGHANFDTFLLGLVGVLLLAVGGWFSALIYQKYLPPKPAVPAGWGGQNAQGYQQWGAPQQGYQPPPGGYGWPQQQPQASVPQQGYGQPHVYGQGMYGQPQQTQPNQPQQGQGVMGQQPVPQPQPQQSGDQHPGASQRNAQQPAAADQQTVVRSEGEPPSGGPDKEGEQPKPGDSQAHTVAPGQQGGAPAPEPSPPPPADQGGQHHNEGGDTSTKVMPAVGTGPEQQGPGPAQPWSPGQSNPPHPQENNGPSLPIGNWTPGE